MSFTCFSNQRDWTQWASEAGVEKAFWPQEMNMFLVWKHPLSPPHNYPAQIHTSIQEYFTPFLQMRLSLEAAEISKDGARRLKTNPREPPS